MFMCAIFINFEQDMKIVLGFFQVRALFYVMAEDRKKVL